MEQKCAKLITTGTRTFTIAKRVIWAHKERVVINSRFLEDPEAVLFNDRAIDHTKVCKPNAAFLEPFNEVELVLNNAI